MKSNVYLKVSHYQDFPGIQWLRVYAPSARSQGSILAQGTRSHMLHLKILCAETKTW